MTTPENPATPSAEPAPESPTPAPTEKNQLTKFKDLWQSTLSEDEKEFWRQLFISPKANSTDVLNTIREDLKIDLRHDHELYAFRDWEMTHRLLQGKDVFDWQAHRESLKEHPDWDLTRTARTHEDFLKEMLLHAVLHRNYGLGLRAIHAEVQYHTLELNRVKFKESFRSKYFTALDLLDKEAKKHPTIKDALQKLRQAIDNQFPRAN